MFERNHADRGAMPVGPNDRPRPDKKHFVQSWSVDDDDEPDFGDLLADLEKEIEIPARPDRSQSPSKKPGGDRQFDRDPDRSQGKPDQRPDRGGDRHPPRQPQVKKEEPKPNLGKRLFGGQPEPNLPPVQAPTQMPSTPNTSKRKNSKAEEDLYLPTWGESLRDTVFWSAIWGTTLWWLNVPATLLGIPQWLLLLAGIALKIVWVNALDYSFRVDESPGNAARHRGGLRLFAYSTIGFVVGLVIKLCVQIGL